MIMQQESAAATRLQAVVRRHQAKKKVDGMRKLRQEEMNRAATVVRKYWLRAMNRRWYLELKAEFKEHESSIITVQRYTRGYLVRMRMWRDAIQAEERLWGAVEIQRCWRGYLGRLRWELEYESVWSREEASRTIQRFVRGWLGRTRALRLRKRIARYEFEQARRRFKAAQKIQAAVRGRQARQRINARRRHLHQAATEIQRVYRGHLYRRKLWEKVVSTRIVQIQAASRGFLVRNRRFRLIAQVILIQRHYRHWLHRVPEEERSRRVDDWRRRRKEARAAR